MIVVRLIDVIITATLINTLKSNYIDYQSLPWLGLFKRFDIKIVCMEKTTVKNIKRAKAIFGLITAAFSFAIAIQQVYQLNKGQVSQA